MATATRETYIANPGKKRGRMASKRLSAKQIKYFGTKRQKAALRTKRKSSHRPRTKARRKNAARKVITGYGSTVMNPGKTNVVFNKGKRANPKHRRKAKRTKPARKPNLGGIFALANPAKRSKRMARKRTRKSSSPKHRRAGSAKRRSNPVRHHRRRGNPGMGLGQAKDWVYGGVGVIAGVVGTRALPQLLLGASNTGIMGYLANAAATGLLTFAAHMASKNKVLTASVLAGGAASIISRVIQDYSLLGSYSSQVGLGDYLMSDWLTPQYLTDGLHNANLNRPGASAPVAMPGASVGSLAGITGAALY